MDYLGTVTGLAVPWDCESFAWLGEADWNSGTMEAFAPTAFDDFFAKKTNVRALIAHSRSAPLGGESDGNLYIWRNKVGLWFSLNIPNTGSGHEARRRLQDDTLRGVSIGFTWRDYAWEPSGRPDGTKIKVITKADLREISLC